MNWDQWALFPAGEVTSVPSSPPLVQRVREGYRPSWPMTEEDGRYADALSRGEAVFGGPGACDECGHLTLWHGTPRNRRRDRPAPCNCCGCPAFREQARD